ncbi:hypothetical protein CEXT_344871 [Caerostris extrusa]|uniref:Uncharacterized protein n=1 Tax=Caerostris extrusa TaxID=172846 RepID=A0AAV4UBE3_CAEEX|nr:hypothetical protein CEXT_344871 [Caerostris extrusa]
MVVKKFLIKNRENYYFFLLTTGLSTRAEVCRPLESTTREASRSLWLPVQKVSSTDSPVVCREIVCVILFCQGQLRPWRASSKALQSSPSVLISCISYYSKTLVRLSVN